MAARREAAAGWAQLASVLFGLYALVGGFISFAGWAADMPRLADWDGNGISIQPNATLAAVLAGTTLILLAFGQRWIAILCGLVVMAVGGTVLFQYLSGIDLHIDTLLMFGHEWGRGGVLFPGRMGPPGAISWTIIGLALVVAASSRRALLRGS